MWIFSQIRNENRDPGILYYTTGNNVKFRVFPFGSNEWRKTGIQFVHKDGVVLDIAGNKVVLGDDRQVPLKQTESKEDHYITNQEKRTLKVVKRRPYFHFIVNTSADDKKFAGAYGDRISDLLGKHPEMAPGGKVSLVSSVVKTVSLKDNWKSQLASEPFSDGFFLERAIDQTLVEAGRKPQSGYPVIVVLGDSLEDSMLPQNFADLGMCYPEGAAFYVVNKQGKMRSHSLLKHSRIGKDVADFEPANPVVAYPDAQKPIAYLPLDSAASVVFNPEDANLSLEAKDNRWADGLALQLKWMNLQLHPEMGDSLYAPLVKESFKSGIMTPLTSYLVVENEAQKAMLKHKQDQALSSKSSFDLGDEEQEMSEPGLLWLLLLGLPVVWVLRKKLA